MKSNLVLDSTKMFDVMNENHLFEGMGITKVNSTEEFENLFNPKIRQMLQNQSLGDKILDSKFEPQM